MNRTTATGADARAAARALAPGPDEKLSRRSPCSRGHTRSRARLQAACAFYCLWVRELLQGSDAAWAASRWAGCAMYSEKKMPRRAHELERPSLKVPTKRPRRPGSGYVVDSAALGAHRCWRAARYEQVVKASRVPGLRHRHDHRGGGGSIAGVRDGIHAIPDALAQRHCVARSCSSRCWRGSSPPDEQGLSNILHVLTDTHEAAALRRSAWGASAMCTGTARVNVWPTGELPTTFS